MQIAVVGAHLTGQPLNGQLTERQARYVRTARTAACYRLFTLPNTTPAKPGLLRVAEAAGPGIEVEVWDLPAAGFAEFVEVIPPPLGIGTIELADGTRVKGFLVEGYAVAAGTGAAEITETGGWRNYLERMTNDK
jgi:allophanate hydrolase